MKTVIQKIRTMSLEQMHEVKKSLGSILLAKAKQESKMGSVVVLTDNDLNTYEITKLNPKKFVGAIMKNGKKTHIEYNIPYSMIKTIE